MRHAHRQAEWCAWRTLRLDVPYQSLMKLWLAEKLDEAEKRSPSAKRLAAR
ncbi:MAG: hypothetical protein ABL892_04135 [Thiobacillaceae bacterium]